MLNTITSFLSGIILGMFLFYFIFHERRRKKNKGKRAKINTFPKIITVSVMVHGMILTTWSYILACFGLDPVVDVSSTIVREIVAPIIVYLATNMIMNIFEKNRLSFSIPLNSVIVSKDKDGKKQIISGNNDYGAEG